MSADVSATTVINIRYALDDWVGDLEYVYIGRPSKFGNPFKVPDDGSREEVISLYREWILTQPDLLDALPELEGKRLGCWCAPLACHGDVLKELIESQSSPKETEA